MSLRTFTVFQDTPSSEWPRSNSCRSNMSTRSSTHSVTSSTAPTVSNNLDKENFDPVTGEHAAPIKLVGKKRKTGVLAAKGQPSSKLNAENIDRSQPGNKKRKSSPPPSSAELKTRKHAKGPGSSKTTKLASLKITTSLPRLTEEEEVTRMLMTQEEINSICKELTVKPLADVSEAYDDELNALDSGPSASDVAEERNGVCTVKSSSVEPEIRDFFKLPTLFSSPSSRCLRFGSPDAPEPCVFSTPQRKEIYSAFVFSSPLENLGRVGSCSKSASPAQELA